MQEHIRIGMSDKMSALLDNHPAKDHRSTRLDPVRVVPDPDSKRSSQ
jgi:hypothetical protein